MKTKIVKELMVSLSEYATVFKEATLYEAVVALETAQAEFNQNRYPHRAVLIYDENYQIVGKISQMDVLRSLEPKYDEIIEDGSLARLGLSPIYQKSLLDQYKLWNKPLNDICRKAAELKVTAFMQTPTEGEVVDENASLDEAINQLIMGRHQSLLVTRGKEIVGILRKTDVFMEIVRTIKDCKL